MDNKFVSKITKLPLPVQIILNILITIFSFWILTDIGVFLISSKKPLIFILGIILGIWTILELLVLIGFLIAFFSSDAIELDVLFLGFTSSYLLHILAILSLPFQKSLYKIICLINYKKRTRIASTNRKLNTLNELLYLLEKKYVNHSLRNKYYIEVLKDIQKFNEKGKLYDSVLEIHKHSINQSLDLMQELLDNPLSKSDEQDILLKQYDFIRIIKENLSDVDAKLKMKSSEEQRNICNNILQKSKTDSNYLGELLNKF